MTMGLVILAAAAILIFFGLTDRLTRSVGLANWMAFLCILALAVGAIAPNIRINDRVSINVGAFILPMLAMLALGLVCLRRGVMLRAIIAEVAVGTVASLLLYFFPQGAMWQRLLCAAVIGLGGGVLAFLIAQSREAVLFATLGGVVMGELSMRIFAYFMQDAAIVLGSGIAFDGMLLAAAVALAAIELFIRARQADGETAALRGTLRFEAGNDSGVEAKGKKTEDFSDYFEDEV